MNARVQNSAYRPSCAASPGPASCACASCADACEAWFLKLLGSADRLWDTPVPGPLRITAVGAGESGSVREALGRLAAEGRIDADLAAVEFLNRGWLEETLGPEERVLILSRNRERTAADSGGRRR